MPEIAGALAPDGATAGGVPPEDCVMDVVGAETAVVAPFWLVAVTDNRSAAPASDVAAVYCAPPAAAMGVHERPFGSQRSHWELNEIPGPLQEPVVPVSVWPTTGLPPIVGKAVFFGG